MNLDKLAPQDWALLLGAIIRKTHGVSTFTITYSELQEMSDSGLALKMIRSPDSMTFAFLTPQQINEDLMLHPETQVWGNDPSKLN